MPKLPELVVGKMGLASRQSGSRTWAVNHQTMSMSVIV